MAILIRCHLTHALSEQKSMHLEARKNQCPVNDLAHALSEQGTGSFLVEARRIELLSETISSGTSPGAVGV
jgi:hypothetical protein